jgi:hypothetical protein
VELVYVDPESIPKFFTSSAETEKRLVIVKAIWDEKAKIAASGDSYQEYRPCLEEVQQIIRDADAIIFSSSHPTLLASQPSQPPPLEPLFSYDEADGGNERSNDNAPLQLPIANSQTSSRPISEPLIYAPSVLLPNSDIEGKSTDIEGTVAQLPHQDASTQSTMLAQDSDPAGAASIPLDGWLKDCAFYTDDETDELFRGS